MQLRINLKFKFKMKEMIGKAYIYTRQKKKKKDKAYIDTRDNVIKHFHVHEQYSLKLKWTEKQRMTRAVGGGMAHYFIIDETLSSCSDS